MPKQIKRPASPAPTPVQPAMVDALASIAQTVLRVRMRTQPIYGDLIKTVGEVNTMLKLGAYREDVACATYELARRYNLLGE
jgi:hypothetical protein